MCVSVFYVCFSHIILVLLFTEPMYVNNRMEFDSPAIFALLFSTPTLVCIHECFTSVWICSCCLDLFAVVAVFPDSIVMVMFGKMYFVLQSNDGLCTYLQNWSYRLVTSMLFRRLLLCSFHVCLFSFSLTESSSVGVRGFARCVFLRRR